MDEEGGEANEASGKQGIETDFGYTGVHTSGGEIGASTVEGKDMKIKLTFAQQAIC